LRRWNPACVYVAITIPYIAGIDEAKGDDAIFGGCVWADIFAIEVGQALTARDKLKGGVAICDLICDLLFVLDLIMNFFTARWVISTEGREHWKLVDDLPTIRKMYVWQAKSEQEITWVSTSRCCNRLFLFPCAGSCLHKHGFQIFKKVSIQRHFLTHLPIVHSFLARFSSIFWA
jgi:hypothetical protein